MQGRYTHTNDSDVLVERMNALNEADRTMLGLYYYEDLSATEIAEVMEMDPAQVEDTLQDIMARMDSPADSESSEQENKTTSYTSL